MRAGISCSEVFQIVVKLQAKHHADIISWSSPYLLVERNQLPGSKDQSLGIPQAELESRALKLSGEDLGRDPHFHRTIDEAISSLIRRL